MFCLLGVVYSGSGLKTYVHLNRNVNMASQTIWPHCPKSNLVKISKFQNKFMKSLFLPKYEPNGVRISSLYHVPHYMAEILIIFL